MGFTLSSPAAADAVRLMSTGGTAQDNWWRVTGVVIMGGESCAKKCNALPTPSQIPIASCTASNNQGGYHCNGAFDGTVTGTGGWAYSARIPAWGEFNLKSTATVSG